VTPRSLYPPEVTAERREHQQDRDGVAHDTRLHPPPVSIARLSNCDQHPQVELTLCRAYCSSQDAVSHQRCCAICVDRTFS